MSLNDRTVAALKPPTHGQQFHRDQSIPGFGVRVSQGGAKTFVLVVGSDRRKITIGRYPVVSLAQARDKAKTILAQRQLGLTQPITPRFEEVQEEFLAERDRKVRAHTRQYDNYRLKHFACLHRKRIGDITWKEVQDILDGIEAPWTRQNAYQRIVGLFRFAERQGYVQNWPAARLEASVRKAFRERILTPDELTKIINTGRSWATSGHPFGHIVQLLAFTGQRRQQIAALDRSHADFDNGTIIWPASLMKSNRTHTIPMGGLVRALLEIRRVNGLYFPTRNGDPFCAWSAAVEPFKRDVGFDDWWLHDLRRTLATRWQEMGIEIATTEKMLSHSAITGGLVGIYQRHSYLAEMRVAVQRWEEYLQALLSKAEGTNV